MGICPKHLHSELHLWETVLFFFYGGEKKLLAHCWLFVLQFSCLFLPSALILRALQHYESDFTWSEEWSVMERDQSGKCALFKTLVFSQELSLVIRQSKNQKTYIQLSMQHVALVLLCCPTLTHFMSVSTDLWCQPYMSFLWVWVFYNFNVAAFVGAYIWLHSWLIF